MRRMRKIEDEDDARRCLLAAAGRPRQFIEIAEKRRCSTLESFQTVVSLIGSTTTKNGLKVKSRLDRRTYRKGVKVPRKVMQSLSMNRARFHGDWNYSFKRPR